MWRARASLRAVLDPIPSLTRGPRTAFLVSPIRAASTQVDPNVSLGLGMFFIGHAIELKDLKSAPPQLWLYGVLSSLLVSSHLQSIACSTRATYTAAVVLPAGESAKHLSQHRFARGIDFLCHPA